MSHHPVRPAPPRATDRNVRTAGAPRSKVAMVWLRLKLNPITKASKPHSKSSGCGNSRRHEISNVLPTGASPKTLASCAGPACRVDPIAVAHRFAFKQPACIAGRSRFIPLN